MSSHFSVLAIFLWQILLVFCLPKEEIARNEKTWIGRALWENPIPGEGWDPRSDLIPPSLEFIEFRQIPASDPEDGLGLSFKAFGKTWQLDLSLNTFLLTSASKFDVRNENGQVLSSSGFPFSRNCFYIGSVTAGNGESGLAAISTCKGIRGMITTNINDYAIQPNGLHGLKADNDNNNNYSKMGHNIKVHEVPLKFKLANMTIPSHSLSPGHPLREGFEPRHRRGGGGGRGGGEGENTAFHTTELPKETPPRRLESELALIVDKEFQEKYEEDFPDQPDRDSLILFLVETVNWMQMWYIHPTFGYQVWYHLTQVVLQSAKIDYTKYPGYNGHDMLDQVCNWQAEKHEDSATWDHTIFMSNKHAVFGMRGDGSEYEGLAILGGECDQKRHCVGVKSSNFQWSAWHRTVAHESGHEFGALDDYQGESMEVCMNGLMRRGVFKDHEWAHCSLEDFEAWYPKFQCLLDSPTIGSEAKIPSVPTNIAFRAEAQQSSTFISEAIWGAWKATDGPVISPTWDEGAHLASCTQTMQEDNPWLKIRIDDQFLGQPFDWIRIINRGDKHSERLSNLEIRVGENSDASRNELCFRFEGEVKGGDGGALVFQCQQPLKGKYISVHLLGEDRILTVCEIQVFQRGVTPRGNMPQRHVIPDEGETCVDVDADCALKAASGKCGVDEKMQRRCRKSCGLCVTECWDTADDCAERKNMKGMCYGENNAETLKVCKKTCNFCGCVDTNEYCQVWARNGECLTNARWMQTNCRKSCKTCDGKPLEPPSGCVDHHVHCDYWAKLGECNRNPMFMHNHCQKSCRMCDHMPCMDYGTKSTCAPNRLSPWVCRNYNSIISHCRKSCGYCVNDGREDLVDMVCYDRSEECGKGNNIAKKCYAGKGWGDWMFDNCKKFCNYCTPGHPGKIIKDHPHYQDGVTSKPVLPTQEVITVLPTEETSCRDEYKNCEANAKDGRCKIWENYMRKHCAKSCGYCGNEGICADDVDLKGKCPQLKEAQGCQMEFMKERCAKTCDAC